jgi:opine dehydrogenase
MHILSLTPASKVLETSLSNQNAIFHIPVCLTNIGCLERDRPELFLTVKEAVTPSVAKIMDLIDGERKALANILGIDVLSIRESITSYYGTAGGSNLRVGPKLRPVQNIHLHV